MATNKHREGSPTVNPASKNGQNAPSLTTLYMTRGIQQIGAVHRIIKESTPRNATITMLRSNLLFTS